MEKIITQDAIIGIATNYNYAQLQPFVESLIDTGYKGKLILLMEKVDKETKKKLDEKKVTIFAHPNIGPNRYTMARHFYYQEILARHKFDNVMFTDTADVIFQSNPFVLPKGLHCFEEDENIILKDCRINSSWLRGAFGEETLTRIGNNNISCAGVVIGDYHSMVSYNVRMCEYIAQYDCRLDYDQAVHNKLIYDNELKDLTLWKNRDGIVCTVGYTMPKHLKFKNGLLVTNIVPAVIHQYNRHTGRFNNEHNRFNKNTQQ